MKASRIISTSRLRYLYDYNSDSGDFQHRSGRMAGRKAGTKDHSKRGYVRLCMRNESGDYLQLYAHRCAWQYVYGDMPLNAQIDHINGNRSDNRLCNLRLATPRENQRNYPRPANNTSGHKGVSFCKKTGRWRAQIRIVGARLKMSFDCKIKAAAWYEDMAAAHFKEFARPANDNLS